MIGDKGRYDAIGRAIVEIVPHDWEKVVFHAEVESDKTTWSMECFFKGNDGGIPTPNLLDQSSKLCFELEALKKNQLFPKTSCDLILHSDRRYEVKASSDLQQPDIAAIQCTIQDVRALDLSSAEIDVVKERLRAIFKGYKTKTPVIQKGLTVYRGVEWSDKPQNVRELSYPPLKCVKNLHRAGRAGDSLFYCSLSRDAPFFETGIARGARIAVSHWQTTVPIMVNNVGYHPDVFGSLKSHRDCPSWSKGIENETRENELIRQFLATEFAKIVAPGQEYLYKIPVAIAEWHFSSDMFGGLLYPCMAMRANADNLAFKPVWVDKHLKLCKVEYYQVDEAEVSEFKIRIVDFANTVDEVGGIQWKGRRPHWVMKEKGQVLHIAVENGNWVARNENGEIVERE